MIWRRSTRMVRRRGRHDGSRIRRNSGRREARRRWGKTDSEGSEGHPPIPSRRGNAYPCLVTDRHEGGCGRGRPPRAGSAGRLGEHAAALERRARAIQRADRQPLGACIRLQRLALFTTGPEMVEPELVARLGRCVGSGNRASHDRRLHVTRERAPWHDRRGYGTTYFSKRLHGCRSETEPSKYARLCVCRSAACRVAARQAIR